MTATAAFRLTTTVAHSPLVASTLHRQSGPGRHSDRALGAFLLRLLGLLFHLLQISFGASSGASFFGA